MKQLYFLILFQFLLLSVSAQNVGKPIRLKAGNLPLTKNFQHERNIAQSLQHVHYKDRYYTLIQFSKLPGQQERRELVQQGVILHQYLPQNTFMAEINDAFTPGTLKKYAINGVYTIDPVSKIAAGLLEQLNEPTTDQNKLIAVHFYGSIDKNSVITELQKEGAQVIHTKIQPANVIFISATAAVVQKIAVLPFVTYISSQYVKDVPINYNNLGAHSINSLSASVGRNLQGQNVTLGIGDDADVSPHFDFSGRLVNRFPFLPAYHGTHTAGTMAGAGIVNPKHKGMAPRATIISQLFSDILVNAPFNVSDYNMVLTNNSYYSGLAGCPGEGDYDVLSSYVDAQMNNDTSLLHVFAAGNDGNNTCSPYPSSFATIKSGFQCSKNILTVGAIFTANNSIAAYSSRGPVDDGRLKPEIVAGGTGIISTIPNNGYAASSGTSMAAPAVTGTLALLYERYRQLHGGANPSAALIKAIACNSADDLGAPGPDYTFGFGSLNARNAVEAIEGNHYFRYAINNKGTITHKITGVPAGTEQIKVMLYWNDPAAAPYAATTLVNNLDLFVTASDFSTHYPLVLNPNAINVAKIAGEGVDNTNNIEQVVINNPASGDFMITVSGTDIPAGPQEYVVAYQIIKSPVTIEYPYGEETLVPGEQEIIRWSAFGSNSNVFTIEYSVNGGSSWTSISNTVPAAYRSYIWTVPNLPTSKALIRITRNGTAFSDITDYPFSISAQPSLAVTNSCPGYVQLSWGSISSATSYEIMMLKGDNMQPIATTGLTSYLLGGLNKDSLYWLAVRPVNGSAPGRSSVSRSIIPSGGTCPSPTFDHDLTAELLIAPVTGRRHTASELNIAAPRVRIRNLGRVASSGSFNISYQVNDGSIVTESSSQSIAASSTYTYTFTAACNLSAPGNYAIKVWVDYSNDGLEKNDTLITVVKHLQNEPIALDTSYTEGFESATIQSYNSSIMGFEGLDRCDFRANNSNGRARTFVNVAMARTGNRAVTLDQKSFSSVSSADSLIVTFNLGNYSASDQLWLDYFYQNQGIDFSLPGNQVWIRGRETDAWIPVHSLLVDNPENFGKYLASTPVNISETLSNAAPAQTVSSSFQVKFGQQGFTSTNSVKPLGNLDDGFTFDDVILTLAKNDVSIRKIINPDVKNICGLGSAEPISVEVKNYSSSMLSNVSVSYSINGSIVTENIASLSSGEVLSYTFAKKADLEAYQSYTITAWVHYTGDNYAKNDTVTYTFTTVPIITTYPYLQSFEMNNGNWHTAGIKSTWQWGKPAKRIINKASNGTKAWVTNLNGNHNNGERSYLYSPCFDLSSLAQPVLSFSHIFRTEDDCNCDFHWVEYSTDGGSTWLKLGNTGKGTNWYNNSIYEAWKTSNPFWHVSSYDIPSNGSSVRLRFVMYSDLGVTYEGVGIDDVHIFDKKAIYPGANIPDGITRNVADTNWIHFDVNGYRIASINSHGQNLGNTTVKVFTNTSQVRNNGYQYYLDRNIVIKPAVAPEKPVSVRYYFRHSEADNLMNAKGCLSCHTIADPYESGITKYSNVDSDENGTLSDNDSGMFHFIRPAEVDVIPYDNGYYAEYQVNSFSEFWINSGGPRQNLALPHIVDSFTVTKINEAALLQWMTLQELNTVKFIVEKSADGIQFTDIGEVAAAGNSTGLQKYKFSDEHLFWGFNYYRIKTVNTDGRLLHSAVCSISHDGNNLKIVDSFRVTKKHNTAYLQWKTSQEPNIDKFVVEKSEDDFTFKAIGNVSAAGNITRQQEYQFTDEQPFWGLNYYRIKTINTIGQSVYSPVRMIDNTGYKLIVYVYPNPVSKRLISVATNAECNRLELRNVLGTMIISLKTAGKHNEIPVHHIKKGIYFLTVVTSAGTWVEKVFVE